MATDQNERPVNEVLTDIPTMLAVLEAARTTEGLLRLGERTVEFADRRAPYSVRSEWRDRVRRDVASLKDLIEANAPSNSAAAELKITLLNPLITLQEFYDTGEPTRAEVDGYAFGTDSAKSIKYFLGAGLAAVIAVLAFAVLVYGLESPNFWSAIGMASTGFLALAFAGGSLGWGLFRRFVMFSSLTRGDQYEADVRRSPKPGMRLNRSLYVIGCIFLSAGVSLIFLADGSAQVSLVDDATLLRIPALGSLALAACLMSAGGWRILESIIVEAETKRQEGTEYSISPRIAITVLPAVAGALLLLFNWLLRS